jgi:hypothetical protein
VFDSALPIDEMTQVASERKSRKSTVIDMLRTAQ